MTFVLLVLLFVALLFNRIENGSRFIGEFLWPRINSDNVIWKDPELVFFYS